MTTGVSQNQMAVGLDEDLVRTSPDDLINDVGRFPSADELEKDASDAGGKAQTRFLQAA